MKINWPLTLVLFCLSIPGVMIGVKRFVYFLLAHNSDQLKKRMSHIMIAQTLLLVLALAFAGALLSPATGLSTPLFQELLQGTARIGTLYPIFLSAAAYAFLGLLVFCVLYYGIMIHIMEKEDLEKVELLRGALGIDGCVLYGGVVEEVIGRWGLVNLSTYFIMLFTKQVNDSVIWTALIISGLIFAIVQIPAYFAVGCSSTRRFIYSLMATSMYQSLFFGYLFWRYSILTAILAHMFFHIGWSIIENVKKQ